ncbi:MAG TPA: hypothetical protein VGH65_10330 [Verrucomicrobiaceae bacterium]
MNLLLSCPKCGKSLQVDEALSGERSECPDCGQWFIVGRAGAGLPVVTPHAIVSPAAKVESEPESRKIPALSPKAGGEARELRRGMDAETRGIYTKGPVPPGASYRRRKCAHCGSPMSISHGDNHFLDFLLPLGSTVYWECERCGKEIKVQSFWRVCLLLLLSPLLVGWWFVFTESSKHHDAGAPWWMKAVEDFAPHDSKGSFWYILFLLLFALAPLALIREVIVRLRYPRIL